MEWLTIIAVLLAVIVILLLLVAFGYISWDTSVPGKRKLKWDSNPDANSKGK